MRLLVALFISTSSLSANWKESLKHLNLILQNTKHTQDMHFLAPGRKVRTIKPHFVLGKINDQTGEFFGKFIIDSINNQRKNITIYINSPGGYLDITNQIIQILKNLKTAGYSFECHLRLGASGAASIFANCSKRIVYINSVWEQHKAGTISGGPCVGECLFMDDFRLETEAKLLNTPLSDYRKSLPDPKEPLLSYIGNDIFKKGIATEYKDSIIRSLR